MASKEIDSQQVTRVPQEFDHEVYAEVARSAALRDIRLIDVQYTIKPEVFAAEENMTDASYNFYGDPVSFEFDKEAGKVLGKFKWIAEIKAGRKKALKISSIYFLIYTGLEEKDEYHVHIYFNKLAKFTTYPYFRATFSQNVAASGLTMPPLPSLSDRVD